MTTTTYLSSKVELRNAVNTDRDDLYKVFRAAMKEFDYKGEHKAVFPMKVNQRRQVIEAYLEEGTKHSYGLEAGSKPELYAAPD